MSDMFTNPASASAGITWSEARGHLLLISPVSQEKGIQTSFGLTDAIRATVVDLDVKDSSGMPTVYDDTLVFPKVLQSQLRPKIGGRVLGRLGQGLAKSGQDAPWTLNDFSPEDADLASRYLTHVAKSQFGGAAPVATQQAPVVAQADPWAKQDAPAFPNGDAPF
jgi:hypothetical protein